MWVAERDGAENARASTEVSGFVAGHDPATTARGTKLHSAALILWLDATFWNGYKLANTGHCPFIQFLAGVFERQEKIMILISLPEKL